MTKENQIEENLIEQLKGLKYLPSRHSGPENPGAELLKQV